MLRLERLESRLAPSQIFEYQAPANVYSAFAAEMDVSILLWAHQFSTFGIPYVGTDEIIRLDVTPQQWAAIMDGYPPSTARTVGDVLGGIVPIILVDTALSPESAADGVNWELTCLDRGWWTVDPKVKSAAEIPLGPDIGRTIDPPDFLLCDYLFMAGDPVFWSGF